MKISHRSQQTADSMNHRCRYLRNFWTKQKVYEFINFFCQFVPFLNFHINRERRSHSFFPSWIHGAIKSNVKAAINRKYCFFSSMNNAKSNRTCNLFVCSERKQQQKMQRNDKNRREIIYWFAKVNKEVERRRIRKKSCHFL